MDWSTNGNEILATCNSDAIYLYDVRDERQRYDVYSETISVSSSTAEKFAQVPTQELSGRSRRCASDEDASDPESTGEGQSASLVNVTSRLTPPSVFTAPDLHSFWFPGLSCRENDDYPDDSAEGDSERQEGISPTVGLLSEPMGKESLDGTFVRCFYGHENAQTIKGVSFMGSNSELVVSGSDCGTIFMWNKNTAEVVHALKGDSVGAVNCIAPHPQHLPVLVTSGLENSASVWKPLYDDNPQDSFNARQLQERIKENIEEGAPRGIPLSMLDMLGQILFSAQAGEAGQGNVAIHLDRDILRRILGGGRAEGDSDDSDEWYN